MAIGEGTLEENSVPCTILMAGNQTLGEALKQFKDKKSSENDTYLVVALPNAQYNVILFSDLKKKILDKKILEMMGPSSLTLPLSHLPIPQASRIVPKDTTEAGGDILDWVDTHPQSTVIVTDVGNFIGLFVNPNRSGSSSLADNLSLLELYGPILSGEADYESQVEAPTCPNCNQQNFYRFNTAKKVYTCPNCGFAVESP